MRRLLNPTFWLRTVFLPQQCVLCERPVCNRDWSPLCNGCFQTLPRFRRPCCRHCGVLLSLIESDAGFCGRCRTHDPGFDWASAAGPYRGSLRRLLHAYKFGGHQRLAAPLAHLAADAFAALPVEVCWDCLVPVPGQRRRRRRRGFDHAAVLGRELSRIVALPVQPMVERTRALSPQVGLTAAQRERNVRGAFRIDRSLRGHRLLIVDDILTSGATTRAIALQMRRRGAETVGVLTVARVNLTGSEGYSVSEAMASSTQGSGAGSSGMWPE